MANSNDVKVLRELAKQYAEIAARPREDEKRELWTAHNSLKKTPLPVLATFGMHNVWCRELFGDDQMRCQDAFYRQHERALRMKLFHASYDDDFIYEPWIDLRAAVGEGWDTLWGVHQSWTDLHVEGGAKRIDPVIKDWADANKLSHPPHHVDEAQTARDVEKLTNAVGDILEVNVDRGPLCAGFMADISTSLARLRGLEEIMIDMYESPEQLKSLVAFMRDGILANQAAAEAAGDYGLTNGQNQCMCYVEGLPRPKANALGARRTQLWAYAAAQEFTLISPRMHEEFLLDYQIPIMANFALSAYGCCEDLTKKIDMLRKVPNLRIIAVTPRADVRSSCEQIGRDYVVSWRPNPADVICCGFDEGRIRRITREALDAARANDCAMHVHLKDVETLEGENDRMRRWVDIVRDETDKR